jgi:hypothetical protein
MLDGLKRYKEVYVLANHSQKCQKKEQNKKHPRLTRGTLGLKAAQELNRFSNVFFNKHPQVVTPHHSTCKFKIRLHFEVLMGERRSLFFSLNLGMEFDKKLSNTDSFKLLLSLLLGK